MAICLYCIGYYYDNLRNIYIFHKILLELPLWSLCRSFRINKSTPRIHRRKSRKYILLFKWTSSWAIISPWRLEFYIVLLFGLDSIVDSLFLRCSSYVTPNQTRWRSVLRADIEGSFTEFGPLEQRREILLAWEENKYFLRFICNYAENVLFLHSERQNAFAPFICKKSKTNTFRAYLNFST